jgi:hypothetical protein
MPSYLENLAAGFFDFVELLSGLLPVFGVLFLINRQ